MKFVQAKNVLPNTYIPVLSKKISAKILNRLPAASLVELALLWPKLVHTQPHLDKENTSTSQLQFNKWAIDDIKATIKEKKGSVRASKRKIIDKILFEYWSQGLNLLQISQIDCQILVDRPNTYHWISSTVKDQGGKGEEVSVSLEPQVFLNRLAELLGEIFMSYIYVCKHPSYPMIIIRIQVFDLHSAGVTNKIPKPHISSHKPFFMAIPINSPHIIHSPSSSSVSKIILQAVERSLPQETTNLLGLVTDSNQKPVCSLESMHILKGNSRFGNSLGIWTPYADGTVDVTPLCQTEKIELHKQQSPNTQSASKDEKLEAIKEIANLRFKGSRDGKLNSDILYEVVNDGNKRKRRKRTVSYSVQDSDNEEFEESQNWKKTEFSSIAPVQFAEYTFKDQIGETETNIRMKLSGTDVFAGLHELSVQTADKEKMIVNAATIPGWLTGEEGASCGEVINGKFIRSN